MIVDLFTIPIFIGNIDVEKINKKLGLQKHPLLIMSHLKTYQTWKKIILSIC